MKKIVYGLILALILMIVMPIVVLGDTSTTTQPTSSTQTSTENTDTTATPPSSSVQQPAASNSTQPVEGTPDKQTVPSSQSAASSTPTPVSTPTPAPVPAPVQTQPVVSAPAPVAEPHIPEILDVRAISMQEFEAKVMNKAASIVAFVRRVSTPYMMVALSIAALLLVIPGASPMRKRVGWSGIVTVLAAYLLVWWGPVLLGVIRGFAQ